MRRDEVRRRADVVGIERGVGHPQLVGHEDRVRGLVELRPERVGRGLPVHETVARHRAVRELLPLEQEAHRVARRREVAAGDEACPRFVEVAGEDLAVGAEVGVGGIAGGDGLAPRRRETRDDRAREGLVLRRLDHVRADVIGLGRLIVRRRHERAVVIGPPAEVAALQLVEPRPERSLGRADGLSLRGAEAERKRHRPIAAKVDLRRLHDVAAGGVRGQGRQRVCGVELHETVAGRAGETALRLRERPVQRNGDRLRVVPVRGTRRRHGVEGDEDAVPGRCVDRRAVGAAVVRAAAAVPVHGRVEADVEGERPAAAQALEADPHHDGVPVRVGHVVGDDPVAATRRRRSHPARHPSRVERRDRIRHVPRLQVGERGTVGDDVLQRFDVGVVGGRVVNVAEDAACDRVPDLRGRVAGGAETILPRQVEVRERTGSVRSRRRRSGGCTRSADGDDQGHDGDPEEDPCHTPTLQQDRATSPGGTGRASP